VVDWLVPVSKYAQYRQESGRAIPMQYDALQAAALGGSLATVVFELRGPLVDVEVGDRVWLYTDELEIGVFGVGRALRPTRTKKSTVTVTIDKSRTRTFATDPLPAVTMRRWLPELRQGAMLLDTRPRALRMLDSWEHERAERDAELLDPISAIPWRAVSRRAGDKSLIVRDPILAPIARLLRSQEFAIGAVAHKPGRSWLVGRRVRDVVVVDVEKVRSGRGRDEALASLGPLREYEWRIGREAGDLRLRTSLWMAFTARPEEQVIAFLEDENVLVSWQHGPGVAELTDRSKQRWYQYLGVR
jgi:hypothetical protein